MEVILEVKSETVGREKWKGGRQGGFASRYAIGYHLFYFQHVQDIAQGKGSY